MTTTRRGLTLAFIAGLAGTGWPAGQWRRAAAQDHESGGHGAHPDEPATPAADAPAIRSLSREQIKQIGRGEGAGFALPAELNGVPGPRHCLDLAADLGLSEEQTIAIQAIYDRMTAAVIPAGERYLDAILAMEEAFRRGTMTENALTDHLTTMAGRQAVLTRHHLSAHLATAALLTPGQIARYQVLRGYR